MLAGRLAEWIDDRDDEDDGDEEDGDCKSEDALRTLELEKFGVQHIDCPKLLQ